MWRTIFSERRQSNISFLTFAAAALPAQQNTSARFTLGTPGWVQSSVADGGSLILPVPTLPSKGKLLEMSVKVLGLPGHAGMPASKPGVAISALEPPIGGASLLGGFVLDPSTTLAQYQVAHDIVIPNLDFDLSSDYLFLYFEFTGESGANSIVGLRLFNATFKIAH